MIVLRSAATPVPETGRRAAIVTIVIGTDYEETWARLCQACWQDYAKKFDFDLIVIAGPLDTSERAAGRSPAWQKLLILNQPWSKRYERIVWLDSDIIISPQAQNIAVAWGPAEKIAVAEVGGQISQTERMLFLERLYRLPIKPEAWNKVWPSDVRKRYASHGVPEHDVMFNTGVLVVSPQHHNELFLRCYDGEQRGRLYEQPLLSHEILERDLAHPISARFNWGIQEAFFFYLPEIINLGERPPEMIDPVLQLARYFVRRELDNAYFLHFYGTMGLMKMLSHEEAFGGTAMDLFVEDWTPADAAAGGGA